jgi:hypothetical protein
VVFESIARVLQERIINKPGEQNEPQYAETDKGTRMQRAKGKDEQSTFSITAIIDQEIRVSVLSVEEIPDEAWDY